MGRHSNARERLLETGRDLVWNQSYGSVTIDRICATAGAKKGTFYYFFDSKAELIMASYTDLWAIAKTKLDQRFSPEIPPLERLQNHVQVVYQRQSELRKKYGHVVGCTFSCLGAELSHQEEAICAKVREVLTLYESYIEGALRDAQTEGFIRVHNLPCTVRRLTTYILGSLWHARIQNNIECLAGLWAGASEIIGVQHRTVAP
jgi:TetR/AcrR family transcriptional repressor of nem operon